MSLFLVISISVDTFKGIPFYTQSSYMKTQLWICIWFLFDFVLEFFSGETQRTLFTDTFHFPVGSHSLSEHYYLLWMDFFSRNYLSTPFYSFVEGGYALAIVVGWLTYNKASSLFVSYLTMLLATVYFSSLAFFVLEHKVNPLVHSYGDALWWGIYGCNYCRVEYNSGNGDR